MENTKQIAVELEVLDGAVENAKANLRAANLELSDLLTHKIVFGLFGTALAEHGFEVSKQTSQVCAIKNDRLSIEINAQRDWSLLEDTPERYVELTVQDCAYSGIDTAARLDLMILKGKIAAAIVADAGKSIEMLNAKMQELSWNDLQEKLHIAKELVKSKQRELAVAKEEELIQRLQSSTIVELERSVYLRKPRVIGMVSGMRIVSMTKSGKTATVEFKREHSADTKLETVKLNTVALLALLSQAKLKG